MGMETNMCINTTKELLADVIRLGGYVYVEGTNTRGWVCGSYQGLVAIQTREANPKTIMVDPNKVYLDDNTEIGLHVNRIWLEKVK